MSLWAGCRLLAIKRVTPGNKMSVKLEFMAPSEGEHDLKLYFMCDAYQGSDQEFELSMKVGEAQEDDSDEEDSGDE